MTWCAGCREDGCVPCDCAPEDPHCACCGDSMIDYTTPSEQAMIARHVGEQGAES